MGEAISRNDPKKERVKTPGKTVEDCNKLHTLTFYAPVFMEEAAARATLKDKARDGCCSPENKDKGSDWRPCSVVFQDLQRLQSKKTQT
jgi:hypothetical protein